MDYSDRYHGVLLIDKPHGISSHDAVLEVRRIARQKSIGHCGTLDPYATGLLVLCLGRATKVARLLTDRDKTYEAEICLGLTSTTYDSEGVDPMATPCEIPALSDSDISSVLSEFMGTFLQKVPVYSSVRVNGTRLYKLARRGEKVEAPEREVTINRIDVLSYKKPHLCLRVECGKGTYIRTLAHVIGERIGCGAYLSRLKRSAVGELCLENAFSLRDLYDRNEKGSLQEILLSIDQALDLGAVTVTEEFGRSVINGPPLRKRHVLAVNGTFAAGDEIMLRDGKGAVLAIGLACTNSGEFVRDDIDNLFRYVRVLS